MSPRVPACGAPLSRSASPDARALRPISQRGAPIALLALVACGGLSDETDATPVTSAQSLSHHHPAKGEQLFDRAFADTNGRACSTCHVLDEHTVLSPANVTARL